VRVLVLSAGIGEGHDLPARLIAEGLQAARPRAEVRVEDGLKIMGRAVRAVFEGGSPFHSQWGLRANDVGWSVYMGLAPTRELAAFLLTVAGARPLRRRIAEVGPDVVVSTWPGTTEILGRLRRTRRLAVPVAAAITDLAALRFWATDGVDLHLITHPESAAEVRALAPRSRVVAVRGLTKPDFLDEVGAPEARAALGLPAAGRVVVVSGGGWAVGDLEGAVEAGLAAGAFVVALCGRMEEVRARMGERFAGDPRVRVEGFTERMGTYLAAADALVHSTAGLTVLEAIIRGCPVISYGWGRAHIRVNNRAFERFGLARVAGSRRALDAALAQVLAAPRPAPDPSFAALPDAAGEILALARRAGGRAAS